MFILNLKKHNSIYINYLRTPNILFRADIFILTTKMQIFFNKKNCWFMTVLRLTEIGLKLQLIVFQPAVVGWYMPRQRSHFVCWLRQSKRQSKQQTNMAANVHTNTIVCATTQIIISFIIFFFLKKRGELHVWHARTIDNIYIVM